MYPPQLRSHVEIKDRVVLLYAADLELFQELAHATQDGLDPDATGPKLDALVPIHLKSQKVIRHLLQRQTPVRSGGDPKPGKRENSENAELNRLKEKIRKLEQGKGSGSSSSNEWGNKGNKGAKGNNKGAKGNNHKKQKKEAFVPLPKELQGLSPTLGGKRVCFAFNLDGCHGGNNCEKGLHACMRCGASNHGARSKACPKKR